MTGQELLAMLNRACTGGVSAIRCVTRLQPADGPGGKCFPPTYSDPAGKTAKYAFEPRVLDGTRVQTVLLDSVQSQANRFEEALLEAWRAKRLNLPVFEMNVAGHEVTSLTVPHRVHDAILRDALWNGKPFRETEAGKRLIGARAWDAAAFYEYAPTALLFGTWDSQGGGGVNTAKVPRALVSEIVGIDAEPGARTSSRIDPLGIKKVLEVIVKTDEPEMWRFVEPSTDGKKTKKAEGKATKPSEVNHGNVLPTIVGPENGPGGVTFREGVQTTVLSFTQLRRLRFPNAQAASAERDIAGRATIAALGLVAVTLAQEDGYQLRSRCQLVPVSVPEFELIGRTAGEIERFSIDSATAQAALDSAVKAAEKHGLKWAPRQIRLEPRPDLVKLVQYSDSVMAGEEA